MTTRKRPVDLLADSPGLPCAITRAWWAWYRHEITFERYAELVRQAAAESAGEAEGQE